MMRAWSVAFALALTLGCGSSSTSAPPPQAPPSSEAPPQAAPPQAAPCEQPTPGVAMTQAQCECLGGRVNLSRGGEQEHCAAGETELGDVRFGIEGGWCCKAP